MRPVCAAVAAALLVSSALSAQPGQRVMRRLMLRPSDWGCTAVEAPLLSHATAGRRRVDFSLDALAEFTDSAAAQPLPAVLIRASVLQGAELGDPFGETPTLTLRLDGGRPQTFTGVPGHSMYSRRRPYRAVHSTWFRLLPANLEHVGGARSVTGTVGTLRFTLGPEQIATLRELAAFAARPQHALVPWSGTEASLDCISYRSLLSRLENG
jgi:hypothetical protein